MTLNETIKQEARRLGFDVVGICRIEESRSTFEARSSGDSEPSNLEPRTSLTKVLQSRLQEWLRRGYHGTMSWMARESARRADPAQVLPGCRSLLSVGMNYWTDHRADEGPGQGRIARYAWGRDYHDVLGERLAALAARIETLAPGARTKWYVDTGPVMEKAWAQRAGLGWVGKHSHLVSARFGSWLLLGEILTTLELPPDDPGEDLCGSCTLCVRACPTGAITEPYVVDARRCISYLTIEFRGREEEIPEDLRRLTGNRIFGCDDCLDVCPYNLQAQPTAEPAFQPTATTLIPNLPTLANLTEANFSLMFRGSPIRRAKLSGFLRNIRIAVRNRDVHPASRPSSP